jgi:hypothetical protein
METTFPTIIEESVFWGVHAKRAKGFKAIVNAKTGKVFSVVSMQYQLVRHEDAIGQVEEALAGPHNLGHHEVATAFYNDGGRMRSTYRFPEIGIEIRPEDFVNPELHLVNSYDLSWPLEILLGPSDSSAATGL